MTKFFLNQVRFLSSATILLLCWQSSAIATPQNRKLKTSKPPEWIAQLNNSSRDVLVPNPVIEIDGKPVNSNSMQSVSPPPFLPRAVAPPVGDMSVSNINTNIANPIDLGPRGRTPIPRLVLRQAPANEVLALLARAAGYNIIFTDQAQATEAAATQGATSNNSFNSISLDLEGEPIQDVFNNVLMLSGLQASQKGSTIVVGSKLPSAARNLVTRTIRLNQASPEGAANFLASQGAEVAIVFTPIERQFNPETGAIIREVQGVTELRPVRVPQSQDTRSALPLSGLQVTTDDRTGSINLVGEANLVRMATSFLTQLDIRRRQVAVNVKVIDVQLDQIDSFGSSFSFGINDAGIVQDGGVGVINFGTSNQNVNSQQWRVNPATGNLVPAFDDQIVINEQFSRELGSNLERTIENTLENILESENASLLSDNLSQTLNDTINRTLGQFGGTTNFSRDQIEQISRDLQRELINNTSRTLNDSQLSGLTDEVINTITDNVSRTVTRTLQGVPLGFPNSGRISPFGSDFNPDQPQNPATIRPGRNFNVPQAFLAQIRANVRSGNAKILTDPTLVVKEGQTGSVKLVENVVTSVDTSIDVESGVRTTTPVIEPAGLTLSIDVDKIDDNGFISLRVNPTISAPGTPQVFSSGNGADNIITPLVERTVASGLVRLRDGQTLILSGIIQDGERVQVSKVPILGDLPIIGSLFRSTVKDKTRSEVVVILTPQILDDTEDPSGFGYNYTPSRETGQFLRERGLNIPTSPF